MTILITNEQVETPFSCDKTQYDTIEFVGSTIKLYVETSEENEATSDEATDEDADENNVIWSRVLDKLR